MKKLIATLLFIFWPGVFMSPAYARQAIFFSQNVRPAATGSTQPCGGVQCTYAFPGSMVALANPPFTTVEGSMREGGSGTLVNLSSGTSLAWYNANTSAFNANQYSCLTASFLASGNFIASTIREDPAAQTAYILFWDGTSIQLQKAVAGSFSTLTSTSAPTVGHEYCVSAIGTSLKAYDNGTVITALSTTDASITAAGAPGVGGFESGGGTSGMSFRAGNCGLTGAPC
jgi:hypothetical protein